LFVKAFCLHLLAEIGPTTTTTVKGSVVRLKPKIVHEVPVPKVRNVTQEQEGGYKIIFPSGVIKKTKVTATQPKKTPTASKAGKMKYCALHS